MRHAMLALVLLAACDAPVDATREQPLQPEEPRAVEVRGIVVPGSIMRKKGVEVDYRFDIERGGERVTVHLKSIPPDDFVEGGEVTVKGYRVGELIEAQRVKVP